MTAPLSTRRRAGFTLLEVLLAVVVFSIVLAAINYVFFGALRLRNKTVLSLEKAFPLQQCLAIMKRDLSNIVPAGGTLFGELKTSAMSGNFQNQDGSEFYFHTSVGLLQEDAPWGEVERISYYLAEPTNQTLGLELYRTVTRNLTPVQQETYQSQFLMSGINRLIFSFYDGSDWRETWDSTTESSPMPLAIQVEIELADEQIELKTSERDMIRLIVPILVEGITNQTDQASGDEM